VTFVAVDPESRNPKVPAGEFDNVEFIGFPMSSAFEQE